MTDGSALLASLTWGLHAAGLWKDETGANSIDSGSAWYDTYETADGKWIAIGAIEPQFWAALLRQAGHRRIAQDAAGLKAKLAALFRHAAARPMVRRCSKAATPASRRSSRSPRRRTIRTTPREGPSSMSTASSSPRRRRVIRKPRREPAPLRARRCGRAARRARLCAGADRGAARGRNHPLSRPACQRRCSAMKVEMK